MYLPPKKIGVLVFLIATVSCEAPFDPELFEGEPSLVVVSNFSPNTPIEVFVSISQTVIGQVETEYLATAQVDVFRSDTLLESLEVATMRQGGDLLPYYTHPTFMPQEGQTYTLRVEAEGFAAVTASSSIPKQVNLENVGVQNLNYTEDEEGRFYTYDIEVEFQDPPFESNYYHLNVYQQFRPLAPSPAGDTLLGELPTYRIFFSPELNTNYIIANHDGGILLEDTPFDGTFAELSFPVEFMMNKDEEELGSLLIELRSVSEEYFLFHSSLSKQREQEDRPLQEPVLVYNNIQNGHGIFAGFSTSKDSLLIGN